MNIFVTYDDSYLCAEALDDKRVNKMLTESCQMLSTALYIVDQERWEQLHRWDLENPLPEGKRVFKPTHVNHPCNLWVRETKANFWWLYRHATALQHTWGKIHKSATCLAYVGDATLRLRDIDQTPFVNATRHKELGIDFTHIENVHEAYRLYLNARWPHDKRAPVWKNRNRPKWCDYEEL